MYAKLFKVSLVALLAFAWLGVTASAAPISYLYIYDSVDGMGLAANMPPVGTHIAGDGLHSPAYETYSTGELNDGYTAPEGTWDAGDFWNSNGGHQVSGMGSSDPSKAKPSIVAKFGGLYDLSSITVNYEAKHNDGINAPGAGIPRSTKVYFGYDDGLGGITWNTAGIMDGWNDDNPAGWNQSNLYMTTFDVSGLAGSDSAQYVRMDITSSGEWVSLIEVGFDGAAVPEPSTLVLLSAGLLGLLCYAWQKRRQ